MEKAYNFSIGDWIEYKSEDITFIGFIVGFDFQKARVYVTKAQSDIYGEDIDNFVGSSHWLEYEYINGFNKYENSIEDLKFMIDIALDWKDKELFEYLLMELKQLQEKTKVSV